LKVRKTTPSPRTPNKPFKRVDESNAARWTSGFGDNSFQNKRGDEYGRRASDALIKVRGKDFRHEKTKKKRGSYRGGPITTAVNSFQFDDSD